MSCSKGVEITQTTGQNTVRPTAYMATNSWQVILPLACFMERVLGVHRLDESAFKRSDLGGDIYSVADDHIIRLCSISNQRFPSAQSPLLVQAAIYVTALDVAL